MLTALLCLALSQSADGGAPVAPAGGAPAEPKVARAFEALAPLQAGFLTRKLTATDGPGMRREMEGASREVNALVASYQKVAAAGVARYRVAALVRAGQVYWHFAEMVAKAPTPDSIKRLGADGAMAWRESIEEQAVPLRQKARALWRDAKAAAQESGVESRELAEVEPFLRTRGK